MDAPHRYPTRHLQSHLPNVIFFMKAGHLAAEYLVSQGLLPHNSIPGKWQNGNLKGYQMGGFQEFEAQVQENSVRSCEGRNIFPQGASVRRRFPGEFSSTRQRNQMRGKKRMRRFSGKTRTSPYGDASHGPPSGFVTCKSMVLPNKGDGFAIQVGKWTAHKNKPTRRRKSL